jgi:UPF0755 protein
VKVLKIVLASVVAVLVVGGIVGAVVLNSLMQPVNPQASEKVRFVVPQGQSISRIGERLAEAGLVKNPLVFRLLVQRENAAGKIQAGSFLLSASMTPAQLIAEMSKGTDDTWIKLLEGWRREEMAESLAKLDLPNYDQQEFLELTDGKEGYLFPDSYLVQKSIDTEGIVDLLTATFDKKVKTGLAKEIAASGKPLGEIVTMASLLEREAQGAEQMKLVSGVLWNRIDIGMALNVDATLQYIKGYDKVQQQWWSPPLAVDKELNSPYNTYTNAGMPPAPIANPGLDAIKAALNPSDTDYLYYLHDPKGQIHFAKTLPEHNANVQQYLR